MNRFLAIARVDEMETVCLVDAADMDCARTLLATRWLTIEPHVWRIIDITHADMSEEVWTIARNRI